MNFNDIIERMRGLDDHAFEDELYRVVWDEIERGHMDPVAQARSIEDGLGDNGLTKSAYIKHRVRRLKDDLGKLHKEELKAKRAAEEMQRAKDEAEAKRIAEEKERRAGYCALCDEKIGILNFTGSGLCWPCMRKVAGKG